jgi:hypothetical protein
MSKEDLFKLINDRLEGWELVELLEVDAEDVCLAFEDQVLDKLESIKELLNIDTDDGEEEETHDYDDFE